MARMWRYRPIDGFAAAQSEKLAIVLTFSRVHQERYGEVFVFKEKLMKIILESGKELKDLVESITGGFWSWSGSSRTCLKANPEQAMVLTSMKPSHIATMFTSCFIRSTDCRCKDQG